MSDARFKTGDRVVSSWLGPGTVDEVMPELPRFLTVRFDEPPPIEYSFTNPCLVVVDELTQEE